MRWEGVVTPSILSKFLKKKDHNFKQLLLDYRLNTKMRRLPLRQRKVELISNVSVLSTYDKR